MHSSIKKEFRLGHLTTTLLSKGWGGGGTRIRWWLKGEMLRKRLGTAAVLTLDDI